MIQTCNHIFIRAFDAALAPYAEAKRQLLSARFDESLEGGIAAPQSLVGRVTHLSTGLLLLFPGFNYAVYAAMRFFNWDLGYHLVTAVQKGESEKIDFYLKMGWNPNERFSGKPLTFAAYEAGHLEMLEKLLAEAKCDPNRFYKGQTLLHRAASDKNHEAAASLLKHQADSKLKSNGQTPAYLACKSGDFALAVQIAEKGRSINIPIDRAQKTLLNHAWETKNTSMLLELIKLGAAPPEKRTLPHYEVFKCVYAKQKQLVLNMVQAGWDINAKGENKERLLEQVVADKEWQLARALVEEGAAIDIKNEGENGILTFNALQSDEAYYRDFVKDSWLLRKSLSPSHLLPARTYLSNMMPGLVKHCREEGINPLEIVYFLGTDAAIQILCRHLTYAEFSRALADFFAKHPRILRARIVDALFEAPLSHFKNYKRLVIESQQITPPQGTVFLNKIPAFFKTINFNHSDQPLYYSEAKRTLSGKVYTPEELASMLTHIATSVREGKQLDGLPDHERERNELCKRLDIFLSHIADLISKEGISHSEKVEVLLDLASVSNAPELWFDKLYHGYCRLLGKQAQELSFEDDVMLLLGEARLDLLKKIFPRKLHRYACYHLHNSRKIPGKKPDLEEISEQNHKNPEKKFDRHYRPSFMVNALIEKHAKDRRFQRRFALSEFWTESSPDNCSLEKLSQEGTLPLAIAMMLVKMGHLSYRDEGTFSQSVTKPSLLQSLLGF